jgi:hypothetical protein
MHGNGADNQLRESGNATVISMSSTYTVFLVYKNVFSFNFKIYEQHTILKLLGCDWTKLYEEMLKDSQ